MQILQNTLPGFVLVNFRTGRILVTCVRVAVLGAGDAAWNNQQQMKVKGLANHRETWTFHTYTHTRLDNTALAIAVTWLR